MKLSPHARLGRAQTPPFRAQPSYYGLLVRSRNADHRPSLLIESPSACCEGPSAWYFNIPAASLDFLSSLPCCSFNVSQSYALLGLHPMRLLLSLEIFNVHDSNMQI